jgi:hypothetical protein
MEEGRRRSSRSKAAVSYAEIAGEGAGEGERVREGEAAQDEMRESTSEEEDSVDEVKRVESAAGKGKAAGKAARKAAGKATRKATRKARSMDEGTSEESEKERPRAKRRPNAGTASGGLPRDSARLLLSDAFMRGLKPVNPLAAAANAKGVDFWPDEGDGLVRRVALPAPAAVFAAVPAPAPAAVDAAVPVNAAAPPAPTPVALEDTAVAAEPKSAEAAASTPAPREDGGPPAVLELAPEGEAETAAAAVTAEAAAAATAMTPAGATAPAAEPAAEPAATYVRDGEPIGFFHREWLYASEARKMFGLSEAQLRAVPGAVARVPQATAAIHPGSEGLYGPWWPKAAVSCLAHVRGGLPSSFLH